MSHVRFRVLIIGGGIGGLALAQGLRRQGMEVAVFERDRHRADRPQGYRLHINPNGSQSLRQCLPAELFDLFLATSGRTPTAMTFYTEHLKQLLAVDVAVNENAHDRAPHRSVSRDTLRQILLGGLDEVVEYGKTFIRYEENANGAVTAVFADGSRAEGDLLIAADGANSAVRRQRLPQADRIDTGWISVAGRLPITSDTRRLLPARLTDGPGVVSAPGSLGLFLAMQQFAPLGDVPLDPVDDFISWGFSARTANFDLTTDKFERLDRRELRQLALTATAEWDQGLRELIRRTDPDVVTGSVVRSSTPVPPWPTSNVTLLGDAIHSMTPSRGVGANTALRDAALLTSRVGMAAHGETGLLEAVHDYECQMTDYGFDAVRASLKELKQQGSVDGRLALAMTRASLRLLDMIGPLKRRAFADLGQ